MNVTESNFGNNNGDNNENSSRTNGVTTTRTIDGTTVETVNNCRDNSQKSEDSNCVDGGLQKSKYSCCFSLFLLLEPKVG